MKPLHLYLAALICSATLCATEDTTHNTSAALSTHSSTNYARHPAVSENVWNSLSPYFLPEDHPIKPELDKIFSTARALETEKAAKKAGFNSYKHRKGSHAIISKHAKLKGYMVKMYTDDYPITYEWLFWKRRVEGAQAVQKAIDEHGYHSILCVPKKWIYPLPLEPSPAPTLEETRKHFILIVEDVKRISKEDNYFWWRSIAMTPEILDAVYTVMQKVGLTDCVHVDNMPFTKSGLIAFIDTEEFNRWPIDYPVFRSFLSPQMREHLDLIISLGGPIKY